jgi:glutaredoxin-like protein
MTDKLLNDGITKQIKDVFNKQMRAPVQVLFFSKQNDCDYCDDTRQLVEEVVELSDKIELKIYDLEKDAEIARRYNLDKAPGLAILGKDGDQISDFGIRFAGIPAGYEFSSLIQSLTLVSGRDSGLSDKTRKALKALGQPVHLLVFSTPT